MSKMSEMDVTIKELRNIASTISDIADFLFSSFSGDDIQAEDEKPLTLEEVRAILAKKSRDGFTAPIRELLRKYGANQLSEVDPAKYKALVADAEGLADAE